MCTNCKEQTTLAILSYLAEHTEAQDTLEGIVEWWLLEQKIKTRTAEVAEALSELVSRRLVVESKGRDSRSRYKVNRRKLREISALIECGRG
jgi:hypothetical protein